jgi:hypothetical protein
MAAESAALSLRAIQLEADGCWCGNASFTDAPGAALQFVADRTGVPGLWCFVSLFSLRTYANGKLGDVMEGIAVALPPASWYYALWEDHVTADYGTAQELHSCCSLLVAFPTPVDLEPVKKRLADRFSYLSASDVVVEVGPSHEPHPLIQLVPWIRRRVKFMDLALAIRSEDGLRRLCFGFPGIFSVLQKQFGSLVDSLTVEMGMARVDADHAEGLCDCPDSLTKDCSRVAELVVYCADT